MALQIWKYPIQCNPTRVGHQVIKIEMPLHSTPIAVMNQNGQVCIWAEVNPEQTRKHTYEFICIGTGFGEVPLSKKHFGSVIQGEYVWHIYA